MAGNVSNLVIYCKWQVFILVAGKDELKKRTHAARRVQRAVKYDQCDEKLGSSMKN